MSKQFSAGKLIVLVVLIGLGFTVFLKFTMRASHSKADDTLNNVRGRNLNELTPINQSNDLNDMAITQDIRKMLMKEKNLSMDAKNIKVITRDRVATLRGPVDSIGEKAAVEQIANVVAGIGKVNNQIEVTTK